MMLRPVSLRQALGAPARLLVDLTTLVTPPAGSDPGMVDVAKEVAQKLLARAGHHPIPVFIRHDGMILALSPDQAAGMAGESATGSVARLRVRSTISRPPPPAVIVPQSQHASGVRARLERTLRRVARLGLARLPTAMRDDARAILVHAGQMVRGGHHARETTTTPAQGSERVPCNEALKGLRMVVHPRSGDVLWTPALRCHANPLRHLARLRAEAGVRVCVAALDPDLTLPADPAAFELPTEPGLTDVIDLVDASDRLLVPTIWMRDRLVAIAAAMRRPKPSVTVARLCWDAGKGEESSESAELEAIEPPRERRFALAVGTVTPGSNVGMLVGLWETLSTTPDFDLDLVVVGAAAPDGEAAASEIEASPLFGTRIRWIEACPPETLRALYRASHVVLCPGLRDGIAFSVTQALCHGRPVIAADQGAVPEAAMGQAQLIDPEDRTAWLAATVAAAASPRREVPRREGALSACRSRDVAAELVEASLRDFVATASRGAA